ncbi:autotransporter-associated beta strand repeat-containing protein [Sinorhizobium meliloti]|uniref:autotransporter-associated beta strand repeat-containing protein n=1 Tax=Rhizobium meliloti TaxID=382 RepID=UPI003F176415
MTKWKGEAASYAPHVVGLFSSAARKITGKFLPLTLLIGLAASPAPAADLYWDVNDTSLNRGGTGAWNLTAPIWSASNDGVSGPYSAWNNGALDDAFFGGTAGTVTLGAPITVHNMTFEVNGYTITGNTLTLDGLNPTLSVTAGNSTIASTINGIGHVIKAGAGSLVLSGNNNFAGGLTVSAGALSLTGTNSFAGDINVNGTLTAGGAAAIGNLSNNINISAGALNIGTTGGTLAGRTVTLSGIGNVGISGAGIGGAHFTGTGGLNVSPGVNLTDDTNNYTGATSFTGAGSSTFTSIGNLGEASSLGAPSTVAAGTISVVNPTGTTGTRSAIYVGDGDVSDRNWAFTSNGYRGTALTNNGTGTLTLTGAISVNKSTFARAPAFTAGSADLELLGVISGNDVSFGANAGKVLRLGDANTFSTVTITGEGKVEAATLADAGVASSLGAGSSTSISGTLSYTGAGASTNRSWSLSGTLANDGTGALALSGGMGLGGTATLGGTFTGADNVVSGVISGAGNLRGAGNGTWVISGANTYTGQTIVDSGTLRAGSADAFTSSTRFQVNGGTLDLDGFSQTLTTLTGTGGTLDLGSAELTIEAPTGTTASFGGSITGTGGLTKLGASTQTLTGASTYTGDTTIGGGILALDFSTAGGPTSNIVGSDSALVMTGGTLNVTGAANEANTQTFDGLTITAGNNTISAVSGTGGSMTVNLGAINRTGGLMNFNLPTNGDITTSNTSLGGWATVNGTDYAKVVGGNILAFTDADYTDKDNAANWLNNEYITDVNGFFGTVTGSKQLGGLRYTVDTSTTVTVSGGETLGVDGTIIVAPTVGTANQTITGGKVTGANGGVLGVQQNSTGNFTIASQIVDNGPGMGFTKAGTGLVTLTNTTNSYTGATRVVQGTLAVASIRNGGEASSIGAASADSSNLVLEGSTLRYTGTGDVSNRGFTFAKSGAILGAGVQVVDPNANLVLSGLVTSADGAGFTKSGAGTLTLANANNDFAGAVSVTGGLLSVGTLPDGGLLSPIGQSSSDPANVTLNGGGLQYTGITTSSNRGFTLGGSGGTIDVSTAATTLTLDGPLVGAGKLTKNGDGTLILAGANTYTGGNTVNAGVLRAGQANVFGGGPVTLANRAGVALDLANYNNLIGPLNGGGANGGNVTLGSATLQINGGNGNYSGSIGGTGGILRTGGGTQTFNGCNSTYTGRTTLQGGNLSVDCFRNGGEASGIGASSSDATNLVFNNGSLVYTGGSVTTDRGFQLLGGTGGIGVNAGTTMEFMGNIIGGGSFRKDGAGTLVLSGTNTSTGNTQVTAGILRAGIDNAFGPQGQMTLNNTAGVLLDLDGYDTAVSSLTGGGTAGGNISLGDATLTLLDGSNQTYGGAISGTGSLVKNGSNLQALSGCNSSYTGGTTINGGTLQVSCLANGGVNSSIGASSSTAANLVLNGSTLRYVGTGDSTNRQFTLGAGNSTLDSSGTGAVQFTYGGAVTLAGGNVPRTLTLTGTNTGTNILAAQLDDSGTGVTSLTKTGAGTWRLTNQASGYTGATTISGGILIVDKLADGGMESSIGASSNARGNLVIGNGSTLRYVGTGDTTDRQFTLDTGVTYIQSSGTGALVFENTGTVGLTGTNATRTIALGGTNTDLNTMGGAIADNGTGATTLAKNDSGTWVLTGNNSYTGNTVVNNGNLMIGNGGTSGNAGAGNVIVDSPTSTLSLNRSDTFTFGGTLSGPGTLAQIGTGASVLTSLNNRIGATTISAGTLQVDGGLETPTIAMTGSSTLTVGGTVQAAGPTQTAITGDAGNNTINVSAGGILRATGDLGGGSDVINLTGTLNTGAGALNLGAGNDTLILRDGGAVAGTVNAGTGAGDTLQVDTNAALTVAGASVTAFESLNKQGSGTLTLIGNHGYSAGTTIAQGTLQIGNGAAAGALMTPTVTNNGLLAFNLNSNYSFDGVISGSGGVNKLGTGITTLTGDNSYTGATNVNAGTLLVNGNQSGATGLTAVTTGATLGGTGTIGGSVTVANGGTLSPGGAGNAPGALTINGGLTLSGTSNVNVNLGQANVVGGPLNDIIDVGGNLVLDGTLNVAQTPGGTFGPGVYRIFNYSGSLTNNGLDVTEPDYFTQTSVANQVNLVNSTGLALSFWDGDAGPHGNNAVNGGDGTWRAAGDTDWTDSSGTFVGPFANASFAIFQGAAGTVTVDNANGQVQAVGMQFATNGYTVEGNPIVLVDDSTQAGLQSIIRVGDGTAAGAGYVATINSVLSGNTRLVKTDLGTLVLSGTNTYSAGTAINGGTVEISADANLGAAGGVLGLDGGTLRNTAAVVSGRTVTLNAGGGTFATLDTLTLNGVVGGAGALTKTGAGTLVLAGTNSYQGGTVINGGTVAVSADANLGNAAGALAFNGGTLNTTGTFTAARTVTLNAGGGTFDTDNLTRLTLTNTVGGVGALTKAGAGTLVLTGTNSYGGGTTIAGGTLQLGNGGATGSITGNVLNNGTFAFDRSDTYTFAGSVSGTGAVEQLGSGVTILTADNSYTGATDVRQGTLIVNGDQSAATGFITVEAGGVLGGIGTIGGDVAVLDGGALNPGNLGAVPGTLTINGNLALAANAALNYNFGQANVVGGPYNDLTVVHGDLVLDGAVNVAETPGGNFGPGIYRIISYDGTLTDLGLSESSPNHLVQTAVAGQVNLVDISATTLNFWDGDAGPKADDLVNGGNGTWRAAGDDNWSDDTGNINAAFSNGSFAVFAGAAGTVSVDNANGQVQASGMQFATGGYVISGDDVDLTGPQSILRVGDGTAAGAGYVATITSVLAGDSELVKTDLGTLVLTGNNTYTGGTEIRQGTLQFSSDANLGHASGGLTLDSGTLRNTVTMSSARGATLAAAGGTFETAADLTLSGVIGGAGGFTKTGSGALILSGTNAYAGATTVSAGSLIVNGDQTAATGATAIGSGATLGGRGIVGGDVTIADGASLSPGNLDGMPGTLTIAGDLALSGGSTLNFSFGEANVAGGALNDLTVVGGDLVLDGTLNVSVAPGGAFGPGIYRVFSYNGSLTNNGLAVGTIPSAGYFVQTAIAGQVNLVNTAGLTLNYWDGGGARFDGNVGGGDGTWQTSTGNDNWADSTGMVNAPFSDGSFAIFAGGRGTVTVDNSLGQVEASGMQFMTDGYVIQGGALGLVGPVSTIRVGDGTSAGAGIVATIASDLTGNTRLAKTDLGTLVLTADNSYTGGTEINGGTLQVSAEANLGDAAGALTFNGGTLRTTASFSTRRSIELAGQGTIFTDTGTTLTLNGAPSGNGKFVKGGGGTAILSSDASAFGGTTSVEGGTLSVTGSLCGDVNVRTGGRLQGTGTVCDTNNAGTVAPGVSIGTLTVAGNYAGSSGVLEIETELGGDASPTDRLVVTGDTSGPTGVRVVNLGGGGAQTVEGIKIIDVGGASNGTFSLIGDYLLQGEQTVVGGAYAYRLYKNGISTPADGDWYLRSSLIDPADPADPLPLYQPGVPLYEAYAGVLQSFNELGTLQQRIGNRSWATAPGAAAGSLAPVDPIWARIEAAHADLDPQTSTSGTDYDGDTWKLQAGADALLYEDAAAGQLIGGVTAHYGTVSSDVSSIYGLGSIDASGYGFGGTLTWYGNGGLYVDGQAQATWYDSDLTSATLGRTLADGNDGFGYGLSIETGQKIALRSNWSITPQAQLVYSSVRFSDFTDPFDARVSLDDGEFLIGRIGLSADYESEWRGATGQMNRAHVYGVANLYYDFLGRTTTDVAGARFTSENDDLWGGIGIGGSLNWAEDKYSLYGEATAKTSINDFGDSGTLSGTLGFRIRW